MAQRSLIYRNLFIYRLVMSFLYLGKYKRRFAPIIDEIRTLPHGSQVLELCFGDIYIAEFCRRGGLGWTGFDVNPHFVQLAARRGYNAHEADLTKMNEFPKSDVCVMMGSLYHFHHGVEMLFRKMLMASSTIILSEPVLNLSSRRGLIGLLARGSANAGKGNEIFRYNRSSLLKLLEENSQPLGFRITAIQDYGKDLIVKLTRDEKR